MFKERLFLFALSILLHSVSVLSQSWSEVRNSGNYFFGEGWGSTIEQANQEALSNLIQQFRVNISVSSSQSHQRHETNGKINSDNTLFKTAINSYAQATLDSTIMLVLSPAPKAHVARWIRKTEVNKIFDGRRTKIYALIDQAERATSKGKVDVALRCYYWAFTLLKSLPNANDDKYEGHHLMTWIPEAIDDILSDIKVKAKPTNESDVELFFEYQGKPVNSLDFTYNDGGMWSNICSAKDGVGLIYVSPGTSMESFNLQVEYEYRGQAMLDPEIQSVMSVAPEFNISKSFMTAKTVPNGSSLHPVSTAYTNSFTDVEEQFYDKPAELAAPEAFHKKIECVVAAIKAKDYAGIQNLFTPEGFGVFNRLIRYGQAKVVGEHKYSYTSFNDEIYARGLQLSFSFRNGVRKNFVEDIVFTFNKQHLISNVSFGLGATTLDDILSKSAYPIEARILLVQFLENYQTAFALKRLDYISTIFDEDAIIIVGTEVKRPPIKTMENGYALQNNKFIQYNRYDKNSYLENLKRGFASKEYINLRFNSTQVSKAQNGGQLYGIQIEQDYYSSNYGDHGYLFLEINLNNPNQPLILVRTWQPEPDPEFGVYNETLFPVHSFD